MNIKETTCFLGRAITVDNGKTEITVTLDVGPRIIGLRPIDGFNIMYEDVDDNVNRDCSEVYGEGAHWHIYGGHRLWLSPEDLTTYYPDNEKVEYFVQGDSITFMPPVWRKANLQPSITVTFLENNEISVTHKMVNLGEERELCLWVLTVMKCGGTMTFEMSKEDTGFLANRNIVLWSYASLKDKRLELTDDKIILKSDPTVSQPYKIGAYKKNIRASYEITADGVTQKFIKQITSEQVVNYNDFCCNFESYCNGYIHEIETLSKIEKVAKNGVVSHTEKWAIFKN